MRSAKIIPCVLSVFGVCALTPQISSQTPAQSKRIVIAASAVIDSRGRGLTQYWPKLKTSTFAFLFSVSGSSTQARYDVHSRHHNPPECACRAIHAPAVSILARNSTSGEFDP